MKRGIFFWVSISLGMLAFFYAGILVGFSYGDSTRETMASYGASFASIDLMNRLHDAGEKSVREKLEEDLDNFVIVHAHQHEKQPFLNSLVYGPFMAIIRKHDEITIGSISEYRKNHPTTISDANKRALIEATLNSHPNRFHVDETAQPSHAADGHMHGRR